jgi:hypothetical protein
VSPSEVVSLALRRAQDSGDPEAVLGACEDALDSEASEALRDQIVESFYSAFWLMAEDSALDRRVSALDLRLCPN